MISKAAPGISGLVILLYFWAGEKIKLALYILVPVGNENNKSILEVQLCASHLKHYPIKKRSLNLVIEGGWLAKTVKNKDFQRVRSKKGGNMVYIVIQFGFGWS